MTAPDSQVSEWITGVVGESHFFDNIMTLLASDFFAPVSISLFLLYIWFGTRDPILRVKNQYGVMCASASLGVACLGVKILNSLINFDPWPRPFMADDPGLRENATHAAQVIFYFPTDPSFPANMAAVAFGAAAGMWFYRRRASIPLFVFAILWSCGRVYAGVHYPLDILGGAAIGVSMACVTYGLMKVFWPLPAFFHWIGRKLYLA
ncbi:MAG: phosphatase PAP2 family protein [Dehalococcoidia bacterium]|nr:phosphatase PAP2 family protein [Dehalococcoidia bacterium]